MPTPYLLIEHLTKSVGSKVLFEDISFAVNEGQRIALIARNGIGKSTLLNIIAGKTDYDEGKITFRNDLKIGYLPQALAGDAPIYPDKSGRGGCQGAEHNTKCPTRSYPRKVPNTQYPTRSTTK